ncbi:D-sedoheptulose-7-phosphate isomerase [Caproiciproducens sp. R2]|uniref:D-sedoheptulose-7-phosphate isomerase n=1 Tax=Caproiciproducens sp. R2 TaxID=3435187 RepID=UPI004033E09E
MKERTLEFCRQFFDRHRDLLPLREDIRRACEILVGVYRGGGKLLICGNGGSCADGDHIVGELMKGFLLKRPLDPDTQRLLKEDFGNEGALLAEKLQGGLPAISLNAHSALLSAFGNDADPELVYAQQVMGYAKKGDAVIGISTSGNAANVAYALMAAKAAGAVAVALTGRDGGKIARLADCSLIVPAQETYRIQEYHLAVYHLICAVVESEMFSC